MRFVWIGLIFLFGFTGCSGWGGYQYKSDRYKYRLAFPVGWEVWDRSDDRRDFLVGTHLDLDDAEIRTISTPVAPDLSPQEIYLRLSSTEGQVIEQGTISCRNSEGRFVSTRLKIDERTIRIIKAIFLGNRFTLEIEAIMFEEDFLGHEEDVRKMINMIEI